MTTALIDGDIVAFRCSVAGQSDFDWGDGVQSSHTFAQAAADAAVSLVSAWASLADCKDVVVAFSGRQNFRYRVLPTYKHHRAGAVKPLAYAYTVEAVTKRFPTRVVEGLEGDDVLGILLTTLPKYAGAVCLTLDKDLRNVPGLHMNPLKDKFPVVVTEAQADHFWLMQTLHGDSTDGYTGIPGIGPKKALAILGAPGAWTLNCADGAPTLVLWSRVLAAYRSAGLTEADALQQARVARILRRSDFDKSTNEVLLWHSDTPVRLKLKQEPQGTPASLTATVTP